MYLWSLNILTHLYRFTLILLFVSITFCHHAKYQVENIFIADFSCDSYYLNPDATEPMCLLICVIHQDQSNRIREH